MITKELIVYIKNELTKGTTQESIKSTLLKQGWSVADVEEALSSKSSLPGSVPEVPSIYAGFWARLAASFVDSVFIFVLYALMTAVFMSLIKNNVPNLFTYLYVFNLLIIAVYFVGMESHGGATYGKKIIGIKVTRSNGEAVSVGRALGRHLSKFISTITLGIGFIMAGFTKKRQGLHDMIADCVVVKTREIGVGRIILGIVLPMIAIIVIQVIIGGVFLLTAFSNQSNLYPQSQDNFFPSDFSGSVNQ